MEATEIAETRQRRMFHRLVSEAVTLSADYGADVEEAVRLAAEQPLDPDRAERLWTRILTTLRASLTAVGITPHDALAALNRCGLHHDEPGHDGTRTFGVRPSSGTARPADEAATSTRAGS